jgi:DNA-binding NarL/FixJ family response regulator
MTDTIRIVVADDHTLVRQGICGLLAETADLEVVAEVGSAAEARDRIAQTNPDIALLDISFPDGSGLEVAKALASEQPRVRVIILTMHDDAAYVLKAVDAGVRGYVLKDAPPSELRQAIRSVFREGVHFSPTVVSHLTAAIRGEGSALDQGSPVSKLTPREKDILVRVAEGHTSKEIAQELGISHRTVESHRESVMKKLEIHSVAGLTRFALENELI